MRLVNGIGRVCLLIAIAFWAGNGRVSASSQPRYDWCAEICTVDAACNTDCSIPPEGEIFGRDTTCGEAEYGCGNTCDSICNVYEDGETSCEDGGSTTCEGYGTYLTCGDDVCAAGEEDFVSCAADCPAPEEADETMAGEIAGMVEDVTLIDGFDGSVDGMIASIDIAIAHGLLPGTAAIELDFDAEDYSGWNDDAPAPVDCSQIEGDQTECERHNEMATRLTCSQKAQRVDTLNKLSAVALYVGHLATENAATVGSFLGPQTGAAVATAGVLSIFASITLSWISIAYSYAAPCVAG